MEFTYKEYESIIKELKDAGYDIVTYLNSDSKTGKRAILRHDVDLSLKKAQEFAKFEKKLGVSSTYYVLLTSNFYNVFDKNSRKAINTIIESGHDLGLHFDETQYKLDTEINRDKQLERLILKEAELLERITDYKIRTVSMHMPSRTTLESNLKIDGLINSYSKEFFSIWKYVSDSEMRWREDVFSIIKRKKHDKLHILTHPFWYAEEKEEKLEKVAKFLTEKNKEMTYEARIIVPGTDRK